MEEENNEMSPLGKVLLLLGGAMVIGTILSIDDEPEKTTRESSQGSKRKEKGQSLLTDRWSFGNNFKEEKSSEKKESKIKYLKIDTSKPSPAIKKKNLGGISLSSDEERKYPDQYYMLTKAQQYKYRKKENSKLTNYIAYNDKSNIE